MFFITVCSAIVGKRKLKDCKCGRGWTTCERNSSGARTVVVSTDQRRVLKDVMAHLSTHLKKKKRSPREEVRRTLLKWVSSREEGGALTSSTKSGRRRTSSRTWVVDSRRNRLFKGPDCIRALHFCVRHSGTPHQHSREYKQ